MPVRLTADYLVLAAGIIPNDTQNLVELFKVSANAEGFFTEAHPKLRPVDSMVDGLFIAGLCHHPKPLDEAVSRPRLRSPGPGSSWPRKPRRPEGGDMKTFFNLIQEVQKPGRCHHCGGCVTFCTAINYGALELGEDGKPRYKDIEKCIECGLCYSICPGLRRGLPDSSGQACQSRSLRNGSIRVQVVKSPS